MGDYPYADQNATPRGPSPIGPAYRWYERLTVWVVVFLCGLALFVVSSALSGSIESPERLTFDDPLGTRIWNDPTWVVPAGQIGGIALAGIGVIGGIVPLAYALKRIIG